MFYKQEQYNFYNVGLSYKKADSHIRGKFSLSQEKQIALLEEAKAEGLEGVFVISTCNRTEVSGYATRPCRLIELLCKHSESSTEEFYRYANIYKEQEAIEHLFRMGTGLDSQILGDYEIVGQLRKSFKLAKEVGSINAYTERLINLILQASKRVKNETKLSSGTTSVSYAAVQYIIENQKNYDDKDILVFGLGKMGKHTCKNLSEYTNNKSVTLINRTESKVTDFLLSNPNIQKGDYNSLEKETKKADVIVVCTSSQTPTILKKHISVDKDVLVLDLSMPNNVADEVGEMSNVTLVNVDELSKVTDKTIEQRKKEVPFAEAIIKTHHQEFVEWFNHRKFVPAINALKSSLKEIQQNEINFHKKKISDFNEEQAEAITSRIIQKITTQFMKHLKHEETSIEESIEVMAKVFEMPLHNMN